MDKRWLVLVAGVFLLATTSPGRASLAEIVYSTDFVTNQGWETNNARSYYLDSNPGVPGVDGPAYYAYQLDNGVDYAYHLLPSLRPGEQWLLEYDYYWTGYECPGDGGLALTDSSISQGGPGVASIYLAFCGEGGRLTWKLGWSDGSGHENFWNNELGGVPAFNRWYSASVLWDPASRTLLGTVRDRASGDIVGQRLFDLSGQVGPDAFAGVDRVAFPEVGDYNVRGFSEGYVDNVIVSQTPEPATLLLLGLGGLGLLRRRG